MSNISPLSGKDAWVKYFQSRGLTQEQAQNAVDTVDLSDGLSQEEAANLGLEAEATIDRYIRQGWQADGEAGVETEEQGVNVVEADELERAYAAIARYADAHNLSYEQAQRIYFQTEISFTRQSLSEVKAQREATRDSLVAEYSAQSLTFTDWVKERFGITDANDPVLANLTAYITAHADATPEQLVDYLLLNGFAARLTADIQTDPAEGDNPGLGLSQAITGRTAPADYQVATLEPFYRSAPAATEAPTPPAETTAEEATAAPPVETPPSPVAEEEFDESNFSISIGEDGQEVWDFGTSEMLPETEAPETLAETTVEPPVVATEQERVLDLDDGRDIPFSVTSTAPEVASIPVVPPVEVVTPALPIEPPTVAVNLGSVTDYDNGRDIPFAEIRSRQEPSPVVAVPVAPPTPPQLEIAPEPEIVPTPTVAAATPRQTAGQSLAGLIEADDYNLDSITTLLPGQENHSLRGTLNSANNLIRELGQDNALDGQIKAEYARLLSELSAALQTPDTADDQAAEAALNGLSNIYYSAESAEMAAARGDYGGAIETYEGIENPPAFLTARLDELRGISDTAAAEQTALADLRTKAREEYQKILDYVSQNNLTDQDLSNNLARLAAQVERLDSMQDPAEIQKFIDALPGIRTMGDQVIVRRTAGEQVGTTAIAGTETTPPDNRSRLGDIPLNLNDQQMQSSWKYIFDKFTIARDLARSTQMDLTLTGYFCFNPATGEIALSSIVSDPYLYDSYGDELRERVSQTRQAFRFNPNPNFPAGIYEADSSRGEGWYRVPIELHGENPYR